MKKVPVKNELRQHYLRFRKFSIDSNDTVIFTYNHRDSKKNILLKQKQA